MQFDLDSSDGIQQVSQATTPWVTTGVNGIAQFDAWGRQRMSIPSIITALHFSNTAHDLLMNTQTSGTGTASFEASASALRVSTGGTATGALVRRQTKRYVKYVPGISYVTSVAANVGDKKSNVRKRWGIFDDLNGAFFEDNGANLRIVTRTNASGSAVDTAVNQSSWNIDKLDGNGASGITLDQTKHQLWVIDFIWHGAGPVRFGVHIGGKVIYVHQVVSGNALASPYMRTPILPVRVEVENTGTAASATAVDVTCMTVLGEDGGEYQEGNYNFAISNGQTSKTVSTTLIPILAIRPKTTFNGIVNRAPVLPLDFDVVTSATVLDYQLIFNPTLTGASFVSVGTSSAAEYDVSATAFSGGTVLYAGYSTNSAKGGASALSQLKDQILLGLDIPGTTADILLIAARANSNNNGTYAALRWTEYQ